MFFLSFVMSNAIPILFKGETLALVDPTQVKAVVPRIIEPPRPALWERIKIRLGRKAITQPTNATEILFRDGTSIVVKIPFIDYINFFS